MGIIINLKEIFAADGQEIFTDKVNFNFNKLLELGVGDPGEQGIQGPIGSAGPAGITGEEGQRGNKWFVGVGDPNLQVFVDLIEGDFYLETEDSSIWQYEGSPSSWVQVTDLSEVVVNILETEGSPFIRGFGEASPLDNRFITFTRRGNDNADIITDVNLGNGSNNDTLLLTNWNERVTMIDNFPLNTDDEFNAIQNISVDHTSSSLGRYHLELSSLNNISGQTDLSELNHNLKIRYVKQETASVDYPVSNEFINISRFSLSVPEAVSPTLISEQGIFEFVAPKYQDVADIGSPIKENTYVRIGSSEPLTEFTFTDIAVDGVEISLNNNGINFGLVRELESYTSKLTLPLGLTGDFGLLNASGSSNLLNGLVIKGDVYHTDGSIETIPTTSKINSLETLDSFNPLTTALNSQGYQGIFSDGKYLFAVSPGDGNQQAYSDNGGLIIWDISDPDNPFQIFNIFKDSSTSTKGGTAVDYDIHGNPHADGGFPGYLSSGSGIFLAQPLTGARDIAFAGKYGVIVRREPTPWAGPPAGFGDILDSFLVFELDSNKTNFKIVSWLGNSNTFSNFMTGSSYEGTDVTPLKTAKKVKISGNWAFVMSSPDNASAPTNPLTSISYLTAVDITSASRPYVTDTNVKQSNRTISLDFDISGEVAYTLVFREDPSALGTYEFAIIKDSIYDPNFLFNSVTASTQISNIGGFFGITSPTAIKVVGNRAYIILENKFYIYDTENSPSSQMVQISQTNPPAAYGFQDVEISGNFAYVTSMEFANDRPAMLVYDISDDSAPLLLEPIETFPSASGNGAPSGSTMVGDRIYIVTTENGVDNGGVVSLKVNGLRSPAAKIGNIYSKDIKVSNGVSIGETLQVGRSATIGSGGLWVDKGIGINVDGQVNIKLTNDSNLNSSNPIETGLKLTTSGFINDPVSGSGATIYQIHNIIQETEAFSIYGNYTVIQDSITSPTFGPNAYGYLAEFSNVDTGTTNQIAFRASFTGSTARDTIGISISGEDTNILSGDLEVGGSFNGDYQTGTVSSPSSSLSSSTVDEGVFESGVFGTAAGIGGDYSNGNLRWQRIGNIVHVKGRLSLDSAASSSVGFLPHSSADGISGTAIQDSPALSAGDLYRVIDASPGKFQLANLFAATPAVPSPSTLEVSFSYEIT